MTRFFDGPFSAPPTSGPPSPPADLVAAVPGLASVLDSPDPGTPAVRDWSWRAGETFTGIMSHWINWTRDDKALLRRALTADVLATVDELVERWTFWWPDVAATTIPARHAAWTEDVGQRGGSLGVASHMYFTPAERWLDTALHVGLHEYVRQYRSWPDPTSQDCAICGRTCAPETLSPWMRRYGEARYCVVCCCRSIEGHDIRFPASIAAKTVSGLAGHLDFVPAQSTRDGADVGSVVDAERRDLVMASLIALPKVEALVEALGVEPGRGRWLRILKVTGVIEDAWRPSRGVMCIADDGHPCLSLGERSVDDWFTLNGIRHETEPAWPPHPKLNPNGALLADWRLADGTLVEYAGMLEDSAYRAKMATKARLAEATGTRLIVVTPQDLVALKDLFAEFT